MEYRILDHLGGIIDSYIFDNGHESNNTVYSDRLYQWDYEKYNRLCRKTLWR